MDKKKNLGQFFSTKSKYILQNFEIPENIKNIIEPFCGNGDLISFFDKNKYNLECYDIDPKHNFIKKQDTILNPPNYENKFIITNPPYLYRNKSIDKKLYDLYNQNDLYKCFLSILLKNQCLGGILIIPLNFLCSIRKNDILLRKNFFEIYKIQKLNIFEEKVFDDTTYTVCSFLFIKKSNELIDKIENLKINENKIKVYIYPSKKEIFLNFNEKNNYTIGGEIYNLPQQKKYKLTRLIKNQIPNTNIVIKCIDDNENKQIKALFVSNDKIYFDETPNQSARTYMTLQIEPNISVDIQKILVKNFNLYLQNKRIETNSLFLPNYRESKYNFARKRIPFDLVYKIIGFLLNQLENENKLPI